MRATPLVDNKPGAAGRIAIDLLKSLAARRPHHACDAGLDGHRVLACLSSQLSYNPATDVTPVTVASTFVHGFAVGPMGAGGGQDPRAVRRMGEGQSRQAANCGNPGEGSLPHFLTMLLARGLNAPIQAVPYRGGAPALADMAAGQLASLLLPDGAFLAFSKDNRARVLATSGPTRSPFYPDVATFAEQGVKDIVVTELFGMFMPPATPPAIVAPELQKRSARC